MYYDRLWNTKIFEPQKTNDWPCLRQSKPLEANSDAESDATEASNDSSRSNSLSEASVKIFDDSEDDSGRNFGLKLIEL